MELKLNLTPLLAAIFLLLLNANLSLAVLPACSSNTDATYDYVVVGAGAGGGPLASRLAEVKGLAILVIEAGTDEQNNTLVNLPEE